MVGRHAAGSSRRRAGLVVAVALLLLVGATVAALRLAKPSRADTTTTTSLATTTLATTTTAPPTLTLSAVGDTELGDTPVLPPDPAHYLDPVRAALAAPVVFGNLEGTLYDAASPSKCAVASSQCYAFRVPTSYARIYRAAGFTVMNSANNHSYDFGAPGEAATSAALRAAGITQAGLPGQIGLVHVGSLRAAFVDFAPYGLTNNLLDPAGARALIERARRLAPIVIVYMHAGAEGTSADHVTRQSEYFVGENRGNPYQFAHAAIDAGADLVLASGPHVLRGMEWYRGHLIAYSLGDFANYEDFSASGDLALSAILHVTLSANGAFLSGRVTSVLLDAAGQARVDPTHQAAQFMNSLSRQDFGAAAALIGSGGAIAPAR